MRPGLKRFLFHSNRVPCVAILVDGLIRAPLGSFPPGLTIIPVNMTLSLAHTNTLHGLPAPTRG